MRPRGNKRLNDRARDYLATFPESTIVRRYEEAILRLSKVSRLTDLAFEAAANAAIHYCELARTSPRLQAAQRNDRNWEAVSSAARKLNASLRAMGDIGQFRLIAASSRTSFDLRQQQRKALPNFLAELANQIPKRNAKSTYRVGQLRVENGGNKRMTPSNSLVICLAYLFGSISKGQVEFPSGSRITSGAAWGVAADFAQAALGGIVYSGPAKKALSDHKGRLVFLGR